MDIDARWRVLAEEPAPAGRPLLVWSEELDGTFGVTVARFDPELGWQSDEVNFEPYEEPDYDSDDEDAVITVDSSPTHWMPLPEPPPLVSR